VICVGNQESKKILAKDSWQPQIENLIRVANS